MSSAKAPYPGSMSAPRYAAVNGLRMYYEVHGDGPPLVLVHGGALTIGLSFGAMIPALAERHRVIAVEMQGHGHTADIDREMTLENFADDVVKLQEWVAQWSDLIEFEIIPVVTGAETASTFARKP